MDELPEIVYAVHAVCGTWNTRRYGLRTDIESGRRSTRDTDGLHTLRVG